MKFFTQKAQTAFKTKEGAREWERIWAAYERHLGEIAPKLPSAALCLARTNLHDAKLVKVQQPTQKELSIELDTRGCAPISARKYALHFSGVKKTWVPETAVGDFWVYAEMHLADAATFDLIVQLSSDEIRVIAKDVRITTG